MPTQLEFGRPWLLTRQSASSTLQTATPIANLTAGISSYSLDVPPNTNAEYYYSITYYLPNWNGPGQDYEDIRFL